MNITIGWVTFDHADYDADHDVLYLHVGEPQPGEGEETPEGHVIRYLPGTSRIAGLTMLGPRRILERDGHITVMIPETTRPPPLHEDRALAHVAPAQRTQLARPQTGICEHGHDRRTLDVERTTDALDRGRRERPDLLTVLSARRAHERQRIRRDRLRLRRVPQHRRGTSGTCGPCPALSRPRRAVPATGEARRP